MTTNSHNLAQVSSAMARFQGIAAKKPSSGTISPKYGHLGGPIKDAMMVWGKVLPNHTNAISVLVLRESDPNNLTQLNIYSGNLGAKAKPLILELPGDGTAEWDRRFNGYSEIPMIQDEENPKESFLSTLTAGIVDWSDDVVVDEMGQTDSETGEADSDFIPSEDDDFDPDAE